MKQQPKVPTMFVHPDELTLNPKKSRLKASQTGEDIYVLCPWEGCSGHGYLTIALYFGSCYTCERNFKLHSKYWKKPAEEICSLFGVASRMLKSGELRGSTPQPKNTNTNRTTRDSDTAAYKWTDCPTKPLGAKAKAYLLSRGITDATVEKFTLLRQMRHWDSDCLCWLNLSYGYEIREIGGWERKGSPQGTSKNITVQPVGRPLLLAGSRLAIAEGFLSAMSHFQLTDKPPTEYIILNSVKNASKVELYGWGLFPEVVLALDYDEAGMNCKLQLAQHFHETYPHMKIEVEHPKTKWEMQMDWNDYLQILQNK